MDLKNFITLKNTLKTYKNICSNNNFMVNFISISDKNDVICRLINYLGNVLRFISIYIVVVFTVQRLYIIYQPLSIRFKRKKSVWQTVLIIVGISFILNSWVFIIFRTDKIEVSNRQYSNIDNYLWSEYFILNSVSFCFIMFVPIIILMLSNILILIKTKQIYSKQEKHVIISYNNERIKITNNIASKIMIKQPPSAIGTRRMHVKPHFFTFNQTINRKRSLRLKASKTLTRMLLLISFSCIVLNLPYFVARLIFVRQTNLNMPTSIKGNYLMSSLQITETFYILDFAVKFFIFYLTDSFFRNKLTKALRKCDFFNFNYLFCFSIF